jgi:hypothetical protein
MRGLRRQTALVTATSMGIGAAIARARPGVSNHVGRQARRSDPWRMGAVGLIEMTPASGSTMREGGATQSLRCRSATRTS